MRFLGNSEAKTDAKGRVFFPAVFRKQLQTAAEECLILRKDTYQDCLVLYLKLADIRQEVRFIGMDDTIEIWAKEIADKPFIAPEDFGKELEEIMGNNNNEGLE